MFYQEALSYIKRIERGGSDYGLERMRQLLDLLGSPDSRLKFVHIAGTNGKGSVSAYLTSIFLEAGYRVGTYNSPSTYSYNERWLFMGKPLTDGLVAKYMTVVKAAIDARRAEDVGFSPTAFEIETALALVAFEELGCDICVLETGLGGRWDATNAICGKELAVITPIGLDHCELLGGTLGQIASEKAGIIDGEAVTVRQSDEVMDSLSSPYAVVDGKKVFKPCKLHVASDPIALSEDNNGQEFLYEGERYHIGMLGTYQLVNAALAIEAAMLMGRTWDITDRDIKKGLEVARIPCRFEIVRDSFERFGIYIPYRKTLVFDGAHNPHGMTALKESLIRHFYGKRIHLIMGVLKDKDYSSEIEIIAPLISRATAVSSSSPRALDADSLKAAIGKYVACDTAPSVREGICRALDGDCDVVLVTGSLSLFADIKEA